LDTKRPVLSALLYWVEADWPELDDWIWRCFDLERFLDLDLVLVGLATVIINFFSSSSRLTLRQNKLECFSLASFYGNFNIGLQGRSLPEWSNPCKLIISLHSIILILI
jgi:hypothetical protein